MRQVPQPESSFNNREQLRYERHIVQGNTKMQANTARSNVERGTNYEPTKIMRSAKETSLSYVHINIEALQRLLIFNSCVYAEAASTHLIKRGYDYMSSAT